ncbi:MAG: tol-pal system protein YbgF [Alphaproteobacteria bacterium]|nr:tol-pal system protein YbgF [Alphaproteobacteria bacterium]
MSKFCKHAVLFALFFCLAQPALAQGYAYQDDEYGGPATSFETRLSGVEEQMRALTGQVEKLDYVIQRLEQALTRQQEDANLRLSALEDTTAKMMRAQAAAQQAPPPPAPEPAAAEAPQDEVVVGSFGDLKVRNGEVTGATSNPKVPAIPPKPAGYGLTAQEHYDLAFALLREARYDEAEKIFKKFMEKYPEDRLIENAKYWYAETFYVRGRYKEAILAFVEAYKQNEKGNKAPDSLLKLAMSLGAAGEKDDACKALAGLKQKFPKAPAALRGRAEQERVKLKCS